MALNVIDIVDKWLSEEQIYNDLGKNVTQFIKNTITEHEILPEVTYRTKELHSIVKKITKKKREKGESYSYDDLKDKLGIRIICAFKEDLDKIDDFMKKNFNVIKCEYKNDALSFDQLGYISNHYDVKIRDKFKIAQYDRVKDIVFEVQARTLNQHAWASSAHTLSYKQETDLHPSTKRKIYRLLALYEIADDEFSNVNHILINNEKDYIYLLIRKLEPKFYRFAKVDYDREISRYMFERILGYFTDDQNAKMMKEIGDFINSNEQKIKNIFDENRNRFFEIPILTQPEVIVIWYFLKTAYFNLTENWAADFDEYELQQLHTLWGGLGV